MSCIPYFHPYIFKISKCIVSAHPKLSIFKTTHLRMVIHFPFMVIFLLAKEFYLEPKVPSPSDKLELVQGLCNKKVCLHEAFIDVFNNE